MSLEVKARGFPETTFSQHTHEHTRTQSGKTIHTQEEVKIGQK